MVKTYKNEQELTDDLDNLLDYLVEHPTEMFEIDCEGISRFIIAGMRHFNESVME